MALPKPTASRPLPETNVSGTFPRAGVRRVLTRPHPILSRRADEVDATHPEILALGRSLVTTMRASPACTGLAAPQLGEPVRLFCVDVTGHRKAKSCAGLIVLANPRIVAMSGNVVMREGCMSVPELTGDVARAAEITIEGVEPESGRRRRLDADGIEARCLLHELDHLDGYLFVDRVFDPLTEIYGRKTFG